MKKQNINFVQDMKRHGITKDIESVRAMRLYLENSPVQSENNSVADISIQNSPHDLLHKGPTINIVNQAPRLNIEVEQDKKAESSYVFPFQRRARSLSPPKDLSIGDNS